MDGAPPSFDEWVAYCFEQAAIDFKSYSDESSERRERFTWDLRPPFVVDSLTRLLESPRFVAERYSDDQIARGIEFIFGSRSEYLASMRTDEVPADAAVRCMRSIATCYIDLFDRVCNARGAKPQEDMRDASALDETVWRIWDMDCLEGAIMFPAEYPHLEAPGMWVLETILERCKTSTCLASALSGLGSIMQVRYEDDAFGDRAEEIFKRFRKRKDIPRWLKKYSEWAM